ncbi:iris [Rhipicephalus microplus]|uniref:iris n=1 Tax=Rhipicephalus microplus TaxID=6941 RepID=UPI003F6AFAE3
MIWRPLRTVLCDDIAATVLEVPYHSPLLESLVVFLPDSPFGGLASLERRLSKDKIMDCLDRLEQRGLVDVTLPRLRLCCAMDFARLLPAMGVRDAFGDAADFSDMTGAGAAGRLKVSAAKHFAVFRLGLRSAAARSEARLTGIPPIADCADGRNLEFTVDRPFLFLVLGKDPSSVVFLGSVTKPSV